MQSSLLLVIPECDRSHTEVTSARITSASKGYGITPSYCRPGGLKKCKHLELLICMFKCLKSYLK